VPGVARDVCAVPRCNSGGCLGVTAAELLKAKYNTLLEEKAKQAKDLIEAEEAKIKVARCASTLSISMHMAPSQAGIRAYGIK
jgi:hypothetical protein